MEEFKAQAPVVKDDWRSATMAQAARCWMVKGVAVVVCMSGVLEVLQRSAAAGLHCAQDRPTQGQDHASQ